MVSNYRGGLVQVNCSDHARPLAQLCVDNCAKQAVVTERRRSQVAFDYEDDAAACFLQTVELVSPAASIRCYPLVARAIVAEDVTDC